MIRDHRSVVGASIVLLALLSAAWGDAETVVLPVVARGVHGMNGSVWDSEVRISGPNMQIPWHVKRVWVALADGGFVDDPASAPNWPFPDFAMPSGLIFPTGITVLTGDQLLQGTAASKGAVALDIEGTGNSVFLHNVNTLGQARLPQDADAPPCCLPGNGQLIRAFTDPLVGRAFIPWITSGRWPYRVSVGLINPTSQPRTIVITLDGFWPIGPEETVSDGTYWMRYNLGNSNAMLEVNLPQWGFRQIDNLASVMLQECPSCTWLDRVAPADIGLRDDQTQLPYYAYASVVWTPLNDPEFIAAVPVTP
jgi:hypothetical protein